MSVSYTPRPATRAFGPKHKLDGTVVGEPPRAECARVTANEYRCNPSTHGVFKTVDQCTPNCTDEFQWKVSVRRGIPGENDFIPNATLPMAAHVRSPPLDETELFELRTLLKCSRPVSRQ